MDGESVPHGTGDDLAHLKSSRAWQLDVVGTVEELEALEAGAAELGRQIDDVADGLDADRRALIARVWPAPETLRSFLQTSASDVPRGTS